MNDNGGVSTFCALLQYQLSSLGEHSLFLTCMHPLPDYLVLNFFEKLFTGPTDRTLPIFRQILKRCTRWDFPLFVTLCRVVNIPAICSLTLPHNFFLLSLDFLAVCSAFCTYPIKGYVVSGYPEAAGILFRKPRIEIQMDINDFFAL